jgi:hypothetical protein
MKKLKDYIAESEKQLAEKAVSKQQQKFMGMVHAAQKGKKPASKEVAKVAKGMSKKDVKDFAQTKHKGLPKKVSESQMVVESDETLSHILGRFKHEINKFQTTGELDNDLYDDLFDYYSDNGEIPYGIAKARTGDPYRWVSEKLDEILTEKDIEEAVDPVDIPAYRRKSNSRLGGFPTPATQAPARAVNPVEIPAVHRKATQGQTIGTIQPTGEIDVLRKMAGLPPRK